ncbi:accessory Sec system S-layer assembly protein [Gracilibacillus dipsosauri]|uniref:accessory Sec system S-layer assembly protein n=1 Tax=Gracilibacillus dipsosauri TaxID=178340 RepID=UPI00240976D9
MFGNSKRKGKKSKKEETVDARDFMENQETTGNDEEIETELSIPEDWKIPNEDVYIFSFHNTESPKLKKNQISIYGVELHQTLNKSVIASALIRSTVEKSIKFGPTTILLLDGDKKVLARKEFDLENLGSLPPNSARPWKFKFSPENFLEELKQLPENWSLAFELKKKHQLDLEESWEKSIGDETKKSLEKIVENAPELKPGEVNFMGLSIKYNDNNDLLVTILIRNGSDKNITLQQIPLAVKDANGEEFVRGSFKLENFTVKANTSKPWTFIFPASMIQKEDVDLSRWQAYVIQNK